MNLLDFNRVFKSKPAIAFLWMSIGLFCCAGIVIFLGCLEVSHSVDDSSQKLEFSPKPSKGNVIYYRFKDYKSIEKWTEKIESFLKPFEKHHSNQIECDFNRSPTENEVCRVDVSHFGPCVDLLDYGYSKAKPCVFLKLRKFLDFTPEFLTMENLTSSGLGYESSRFIREQDTVNHPEVLRMVWVSCEGKTSFDNNLLGDVKYFPKRGFPSYFFPYKGQEDYVEPVVAIQFESPRIGWIIDVDCKVVARNFNETVSFKLLVEPE